MSDSSAHGVLDHLTTGAMVVLLPLSLVAALPLAGGLTVAPGHIGLNGKEMEKGGALNFLDSLESAKPLSQNGITP